MECKHYSRCSFRDTCSQAPLDDVVFTDVDWKRVPSCFMERRSKHFRKRPNKSKVPKFRDYYE